jgi:hypothetical protein
MAGELSGAELDAQSTPMGPETNPATGDTVSGKTLTKSSTPSAIPPGGIQDLAFHNIASELSGTNTLEEPQIS